MFVSVRTAPEHVRVLQVLRAGLTIKAKPSKNAIVTFAEPPQAHRHPRGHGPLQTAIVRETGLAGLRVVPLGDPGLAAGEFFLHRRFEELVVAAARDYDFILVDSAPVLATADTSSLAPRLDGVIMVVRTGLARARALHQALAMLYQRQANVLGFLHNGVDPQSRDRLLYRDGRYHRSASAAATG